jgi:hypothetical protein
VAEGLAVTHHIDVAESAGALLLIEVTRHLAAGVSLVPVAITRSGALDRSGATFGVDAEGAWRVLEITGPGPDLIEITQWHHGVEIGRGVCRPPTDGEVGRSIG